MELETGHNDQGRRLDRILRKALPKEPLSLIHRLLRQGKVLVNGRPAGPAERLRAGETISIPLEGGSLPPGPSPAPRVLAHPPQRGPAPATPPPPLNILWQGAGLLVLNKPAGLAVHGPQSLDTEVRAFLAAALPPSLSFRPGPLHRLDRGTSGLVVFSSSLEGAQLFSALIREGRIRKYYLALADGILEAPQIWEDSLVRDRAARKTRTPDQAGVPGLEKPKPALTRVSPLYSAQNKTLILAEIATGRTHQIRAQAAAHGHPLTGDAKYGSPGQGGFLLHAWKLEFPPDQGLPPALSAPLPEAFRRRVEVVFGAGAEI